MMIVADNGELFDLPTSFENCEDERTTVVLPASRHGKIRRIFDC